MIATEVNKDNLAEEGIFCSKDPKAKGFQDKYHWLLSRMDEGLSMYIMKDEQGKPIGFIEYIPAEFAWRPVEAPGMLFIHCLYIYANKHRHQGVGTEMIKICEKDAKERGASGVCVMVSEGPWLATKELFEKNSYTQTDQLGRFELMSKRWNDTTKEPKLINWESTQKKYDGWNLLYADQCPWHDKSVQVISKIAEEQGISLKIKNITTAKQAQAAPSGFGVFALVKDGKLLVDHYISHTRFKNILKEELEQ